MALPGHITGAGTQENPYMLTCWNDLYEIKNEGSSRKYYKFIDGVQENLDNLYPLGNIPEVVLAPDGNNVNTYASEIDFNGATFFNGRFNGFRLAACTSSDDKDLASTVLKNLNLINVGDTGLYHGLFHYCSMVEPREYMCPITLDGCRLVIEGLSTNSGFLQRGFITMYTGFSYIKRCNITLKGTEILGASWNIFDSILFFDDVLLDKSADVKHYQSPGSFTTTGFALMRPVASNTLTFTGTNVLAPHLNDCTVYGKVRTTLDLPTALIFAPQDRVIFDIECDNLLLYRSETAVAYNSDKTAQPVVSASGKDIIYESEYTIANLHPLTSDEIQDLNKLYEIGFPVKIPTEGA